MSQSVEPTYDVEADTILTKNLFDELNSPKITPEEIDDIIARLDASSAEREKLCLRSQIPHCNAEDTLVEKAYNGMDAISRLEDADRLDTVDKHVDDYTLAIYFQGNMPNRGTGYMNTAVIDSGAGQSQDAFEDTFLNPNESGIDKQDDKSTQGKNGIGSTAAMDKSHRGMQVVVSSPPGTNKWTMAICCESNDVDNNYSHFDYFVDKNGSLPTFYADSLTVGEETISHGTIVRNYDFHMDESEYGSGVPNDMKNISSSRRLRFSMPNPPLPIDIYETRGDSNSYYPYEGIDWVKQEYAHVIKADRTEQIQFSSPSVNGKAKLQFVLIKSESERKKMIVNGELSSRNEKTFKPLCGSANKDPTVLYTKNGQTHATHNYSYLSPSDLQHVRQDLFIIVECIDIDQNNSNKRLFKPNRDGLTQKPIAQALDSEIEDYLQNHDYLTSENNRRASEENLKEKNSPKSIHLNSEKVSVEQSSTAEAVFSVTGSNNEYMDEYCEFEIAEDDFNTLTSKPTSGGYGVEIEPDEDTIANQEYYRKIQIHDTNTDKTVKTIIEIEITEPPVGFDSTITQKQETETSKTNTETTQYTETSELHTPAYAEATTTIVRMMLKYTTYNKTDMLATKMYDTKNRANHKGEAFENLIENLIRDINGNLNLLDSGKNKFPDYPLKDGLFIEAKKNASDNYTKQSTNSTHPKPFTTPDCSTIGATLRKEMRKNSIEEADTAYALGHMNNESLGSMWLVFGDVLFPEAETEAWSILNILKSAISTIASNLGFTTEDTNELYTRKNMGYRNNLHTRGREMNSFTHPARSLKQNVDNFEETVQNEKPMFVVMRSERLERLPADDKMLLAEEDSITLTETTTQSPDEQNEKIEIAILTIT